MTIKVKVITRGRIPCNSMFAENVRRVVSEIPKGKTLTYKEVATLAGNSLAARAVGTIMKSNFDPQIPCHRVIRSNGSVGGYNRGGERAKRILLATELKTVNLQ